MEPFAIAVRNHVMITGINLGGSDYRIALYADDVILFLRNLGQSIPALMGLIEQFGRISGYKVNNSKSSIMLLNSKERSNPSKHISHLKTVN